MPAFSTVSTADVLQAATRLYAGARDTPEIAAALADYGYTPADFAAGLALVDALRDAIARQGVEQAEKITASKTAALAVASVRAPYVRLRTLARRAHPAGSAGYSALGLSGDLPTADGTLLADARRFYETLAGSPDLAEAVRSVTPASIAAALEGVAAAEAAEDAQTRESGESQRATAVRAQAEVTLRAEAAELAEAARLALADQPQLAEVLGLMERGA